MIGSRLRPTRCAPAAAPPMTRRARRSARDLAVGHPRRACLARASGTGSVEPTTEATPEGRQTRSRRSRRWIPSGAWSRVAVRAVRISRSCRRLVGWSPARVRDGRAGSAQCLAVRSFRAMDGASFGEAPIRIPVVGVAGAESESESGSDTGACWPAETVVSGSGSGAAVGAGPGCATGGGGAGAVAATGGDAEAGGSGAGGASGAVGGWEAPRGGRISRGSTYVSASPTRMPKCT
jgi:hypothetical protein